VQVILATVAATAVHCWMQQWKNYQRRSTYHKNFSVTFTHTQLF